MPDTKQNPFVIGQWVRGEKFYGREEIIAELVHGPRQSVWIAALRRMGKTSLLREIERRALQDASMNYCPVYWDLEGTVDDQTLRESLLSALDETQAPITVPAAWNELATPALLHKVLKAVRQLGKTLLLLCDEVEALLAIAEHDPHLLARLRRALQGSEGIRCLLTATRRLARLETLDAAGTSPFLHGFVPPVYLSPMNPTEIQPLLTRAGFSPAEQDRIYVLSAGHPYLLQILAKLSLELGSIDTAFESMKHDESLRNFFIVDYQSLQPDERALLHRCSDGGLPSHSASTTTGERMARYTLNSLGLLWEQDGRLQLRSPLVAEWLSTMREQTQVASTSNAIFLKAGDRFGPYEILHEVAKGGMGVVYCGRDVHLDRLAAIKQLQPALFDDPTNRDRLLLEARALSRLQHPNIAVIYSVEFAGEAPCLCMEFVEGRQLDEWRQSSPSFNERLSVAKQIASALAAAHGLGIVHRDLKPSNVMVRNDGVPKLLDFGIARQLQSTPGPRLTKTSQMPGTPAYMSPEQICGLDVDARSDVFSYGIVLYELFIGKRPFEGDNELSHAYAIVNEDPVAPAALEPSLPTLLQEIIMRALAKTPTARFADAGELLRELERVKYS